MAAFYSCSNRTKKPELKLSENRPQNLTTQETNTSASSLDKNIIFLGDSLLNGKKAMITHYIAKYAINDSCEIITYTNNQLKSDFEGIRKIKSIRNKNTPDSVFVMPAFNSCDEGESYCFFDESLPRLLTDSYCCQPDNLFVVQDIDEDGINEVGIYYSGCSGRYKSLKIYTLKNSEWKEIGTSDFDVLTQDPTKVQFDKLVKKIAKNQFSICNFSEGKTTWEVIKMK